MRSTLTEQTSSPVPKVFDGQESGKEQEMLLQTLLVQQKCHVMKDQFTVWDKKQNGKKNI